MLTVDGLSGKVSRNKTALSISQELLSTVPSLENQITTLVQNKPVSPLKSVVGMARYKRGSGGALIDVEGVIVKKKKIVSVPVQIKGVSEYADVTNVRIRDQSGVVGLACWRGLAPLLSHVAVGRAVKVTNLSVGEFEGQKTVSSSSTSTITVLPVGAYHDVPVQDIVPDNIGTLITIEGLSTLSRYPRCTGPTPGCKKKMLLKTNGDLFCESCTQSSEKDAVALGISATVMIRVGNEEKSADMYNDMVGELMQDYDYDNMLFKDWDGDQLFDEVCGELPVDARVNLGGRNGLVINEIYAITRT